MSLTTNVSYLWTQTDYGCSIRVEVWSVNSKGAVVPPLDSFGMQIPLTLDDSLARDITVQERSGRSRDSLARLLSATDGGYWIVTDLLHWLGQLEQPHVASVLGREIAIWTLSATAHELDRTDGRYRDDEPHE